MSNPKLEDWMICGDMIVGKVYEHPKFPDGTVIWTSRIARLDLETGRCYTLNTEYELGRRYDDNSQAV